MNMWFQKILRQFFFALDKIIFNFIPTLYNLLMDIARTSVLSQATIADMADRIYKLLAVFMVFKVTFSLIMYVVNPDDFSDKSKGMSKLSANIVISLSLLILTPYIFRYAYQVQTIILEDNSLAVLIYGDQISGSMNNPINTAGDTMAFISMGPFFSPNLSLDRLTNCSNMTTNETVLEDGKEVTKSTFNKSCSGIEWDGIEYVTTNDNEASLMGMVNDGSSLSEAMVYNYVAGVEKGSIGLMFRQDIAIATYEDKDEEIEQTFVIDYKFLFSTVTGVVICLMLITFCMDIGLRSIKLAFLQLIAPIPILSYIDPKSGKDGMFKKWYEMCFKTYLSLFIRLLAIYFSVYIISKIGSMSDIITGAYQSSLVVKIFIVIGALMFAKQFPKILEGLGLKMDGGFTLNPFKKMEDEMLGGKIATKPMKAAGKYAGRLAKGVGTAGLVGAAALVTGQGLRGMGKAFSGAIKGEKFGKNFTNSYKSAHGRKQEVAKMKNAGISPWDVRAQKIKNSFSGMTDKEKLDDFNASVKSVQDGYKTYYDGVLGADKVAKMLEQRRIAAENRGDHDAATRLQDAIDARVKDVKDQGGKISLSVGNRAYLEMYGQDIENGIHDYSEIHDRTVSGMIGLSENEDKGLIDTEANIAKTIEHVNKNYDGKYNFNAGDLGDISTDGRKVSDLKITNGKSKSVQRAANASGEATKINDTATFMAGGKN